MLLNKIYRLKSYSYQEGSCSDRITSLEYSKEDLINIKKLIESGLNNDDIIEKINEKIKTIDNDIRYYNDKYNSYIGKVSEVEESINDLLGFDDND